MVLVLHNLTQAGIKEIVKRGCIIDGYGVGDRKGVEQTNSLQRPRFLENGAKKKAVGETQQVRQHL